MDFDRWRQSWAAIINYSRSDIRYDNRFATATHSFERARAPHMNITSIVAGSKWHKANLRMPDLSCCVSYSMRPYHTCCHFSRWRNFPSTVSSLYCLWQLWGPKVCVCVCIIVWRSRAVQYYIQYQWILYCGNTSIALTGPGYSLQKIHVQRTAVCVYIVNTYEQQVELQCV